jgi:hypothetical protein
VCCGILLLRGCCYRSRNGWLGTLQHWRGAPRGYRQTPGQRRAGQLSARHITVYTQRFEVGHALYFSNSRIHPMSPDSCKRLQFVTHSYIQRHPWQLKNMNAELLKYFRWSQPLLAAYPPW